MRVQTSPSPNRRPSVQYPTMSDLKRTGKDYFKSKTYANEKFNTSLGKNGEKANTDFIHNYNLSHGTNEVRNSTGKRSK
jgi:hypothetical protein